MYPFIYTATKAVCAETVEIIEQELCTYPLEDVTEESTMKTVDVEFQGKKAILKEIVVPVNVTYKNPRKNCVSQPIELPVIQCDILESEQTIGVPTIEDSEVEIDKCVSVLGAPDCQGFVLDSQEDLNCFVNSNPDLGKK